MGWFRKRYTPEQATRLARARSKRKRAGQQLQAQLNPRLARMVEIDLLQEIADKDKEQKP